jgi:hypothetical protein
MAEAVTQLPGEKYGLQRRSLSRFTSTAQHALSHHGPVDQIQAFKAARDAIMEPSTSANSNDNLQSVVPRPEVRLFWTGPPLSPYEELSLRSFVAAGARVLLYATSKDLVVPEGVERVDAREILSGEVHQFTFADGVRSPALHSDLFRYLALHQFGGWYADLDIVAVAGEMPCSKVYIARESDELVNGAVMKFPARSPFLSAAIEEAWRLLP